MGNGVDNNANNDINTPRFVLSSLLTPYNIQVHSLNVLVYIIFFAHWKKWSGMD